MGQSYHFEVKTGDEYLAGTDSNIFLVLYGETGQFDEVRLNGHISGNAFERNNLDQFDITFGEDIGRIYKIDLRSDCMYAGSDWLASYIAINRCGNSGEEDVGQNATSKFIINKWITNRNTETYTVGYSQWSPNIAKYETVEIPYESYTFTVPGGSTYQYSKTVKTTTGFQYTNIKTKKTTVGFNQEIQGSAGYQNVLKLSEQLSSTKNASGYLKFAFQQGFETTEVNELVKTENQEITESVNQNVKNDTDQPKKYRAKFSLIKVNAISKSGDVVALFSGNAKIVFGGFEPVSE